MSLVVNIEKTVGDFHLKVSFTGENEFLGFLGASGSGKSMTLKCIAGIEKPDRGRIILDGRILFDSEKKICLPAQERRIGYLFQNYALFPNMTVRQNILCGACREKDKALREKEAERMISLLGLQKVQNLRPDRISGGEAQRTALGRILVNRPLLLLLDEPFSALDMYLRLRLQLEMKELLKEFEHGVIMVTHDRDEAYRLCDRIAVLQNGRLVTLKETRALFADPGSTACALLTGCKNIAAAEKTGENEVYVPEWGVHFATAHPVRDHLTAIGVRAHYFDPQAAANAYPVRLCREAEEPFEWVMEFRYEGQKDTSGTLCWRLPKDRKPERFPRCLGIAPDDILLLYDGV